MDSPIMSHFRDVCRVIPVFPSTKNSSPIHCRLLAWCRRTVKRACREPPLYKGRNMRKTTLLFASVALLLSAVGLVAVVLVQPARATFPGVPGKIAHVGYDGHDAEIYTIESDGDGKRQITHN